MGRRAGCKSRVELVRTLKSLALSIRVTVVGKYHSPLCGLCPEFRFIALLDAVLDSERLREDSFPQLVESKVIVFNFFLYFVNLI